VAKPGNVPIRVDAGTIALDFRGLSRGIQQRVADLLRGMSEMFGRVREKGRMLMADLSGTPEGALKALEDAFIQARVKLSLVTT
jgi:hypothetical protein